MTFFRKSFITSLLALSLVISSISFSQTTNAVTNTPVSSIGCINISSNLSYGAKNEDVTKLQTFLKDQGYLSIGVTGKFGNKTRSALKVFQSTKLSEVNPADIDTTLVPSADERNSLANDGFKIHNTGVVNSYTRAKIAYLTCTEDKEDKEDKISCPAPGVVVDGVCVNDGDAAPIICTQDVFMCPDGREVGRTGQSCQFVCPVSSSSVTASLQVNNPTSSMSDLKVGDTVALTWIASQSKVATTTLVLSLIGESQGATGGRIAVIPPTNNIQNGSYAWKIPEYIFQDDAGIPLKSGSYKIQATLYEGSNICLGFCFDNTNNNPRIITTAVNSQSFTIDADSTVTDTYKQFFGTKIKYTKFKMLRKEAQADCDEVLAKIKSGVRSSSRFTTPDASKVRCTWGAEQLYPVATSSLVITASSTITAAELAQGWYYGDANQKKAGTPSDWVLVNSGTEKAMWKAPTPSTCPAPGVMVKGVCTNDGDANPGVFPTVSQAPTPSFVLGAYTSVVCTNVSRNLHRGAESTSVSSLQSFLISKGLLSSEVTGFYGDKTVEAVKNYQKNKGLPTTGMVYDFTRAAIKAESCQ